MRVKASRLFFALIALSLVGGYLSAAYIKKRSVPRAYKKTLKTSYYEVTLYARRFAQGEMVYIKLRPISDVKKLISVRFKNKKVAMKLSRKKAFFDGILGIHPKEKPGKKTLKVLLNVNGKTKTISHKIMIYSTAFYEKRIISKVKVAKKYVSPKKEQIEQIKSDRVKKRKVFAIYSKRKWRGRFVDSRNMARINSTFYARRIYNGRPGSYHTGVDLKGRIGAPIKAINQGRVVLAEKMYYEGNLTIIDHGEGIFSYYMHQSKILVKPGQMIDRGQLIGHVGNTGMVSGPHLHLSLRYQGSLQSPLSLLSLPVEN